MKIAIIADMHGDVKGLEQALEDIEHEKCCMIYCLGDMVDDKTTTGSKVIDIIRSQAIPTVYGNHDFDLIDTYDDETVQFLESLKRAFVHDDAYLTHISPLDDEKIRDAEGALRVFENTEQKHSFVAHNHFPYVFGYNSDGEIVDYEHPLDEELKLNADERYIICVGAIGDRREPPVPRQYTIYDSINHTVRFKQF